MIGLAHASAMRVPALLVALPVLAGAAAGVLFVDHIPEHLILGSAAGAVLCVLAGASFLADDFAPGVVVAVLAGACLAGLSSAASTTRALYLPSLLTWHDRYETRSEPGVAVLEGTVREDVVGGSPGTLVVLDVDRACDIVGNCVVVRGGVRVSLGGAPDERKLVELRAGRRVRTPAIVRRPTTFGNPGLEDEAHALARRGIVLVGTVKSGALIELVERGWWIEERAAAVREWIRRTLAERVGRHDPRSAGVATAILIGDRTGLPEEDARRLQDAGTYHVIAISGGNIAIFTALLLALARVFRVPYRTAAALTIVLLLFYGELAGGSASVSRAITAAVIFLAALILDHRGASLNVLATASVLAVLVHPPAVGDAGFLLSFGATAGIVLGVPLLVRWRPEHDGPFVGRLVRALLAAAAAVLAASVCAEVVLLPVTASLFSRVTIAGLVLNFAAIPLMTVVQCGSMALLGLELFGFPLSHDAALIVHRAAFGLVESARLVELAPWLARDVAPPSWWLCGVYYALAVAVVVTARLRRLAASLLASAFVLVFVAPAFSSHGVVPHTPAGVLRVVVLDVGQGDATVAILPDGRAVLVDAGGLAGTTFDIGGRVILPALRALGVRRLHALAITHPDPDHIGGAETITRRLVPSYIWEGVPVPPSPARRALIDAAGARQIPWRTLRPFDTETLGGVEIRVHHPPQPDWERQRVRNDDSVVLEFRYHDVSILLPGDIGREVETMLIPTLSLAPLTILKAAHHGSATSSSAAFIDAVAPRAVIFSTGKNNVFRHPAAIVVERFSQRGIPAFNTAHDGAVFVETDGQSVDVHSWRTGRRLSITKDTKDTKDTKEGH